MSDVDATVTPPGPADEDSDDDVRSSRVYVGFLNPDEVNYDAGVQLFGDECLDPDKIAGALLAAALAVAHLIGPDVAWATKSRFTAYGASETR